MNNELHSQEWSAKETWAEVSCHVLIANGQTRQLMYAQSLVQMRTVNFGANKVCTNLRRRAVCRWLSAQRRSAPRRRLLHFLTWTQICSRRGVEAVAWDKVDKQPHLLCITAPSTQNTSTCRFSDALVSLYSGGMQHSNFTLLLYLNTFFHVSIPYLSGLIFRPLFAFTHLHISINMY